MNRKTFEDVIAEDGVLIYSNVGDSMYPLILPRDLLVIRPVTAPLKRFDVPLYKRDNGQYVLHRIMKISNGEYLICGDNRANLERGISDRHIIGLLTEIIRDGKTIPVQPPKHSLWFSSILYRKIVFKLRRQKNGHRRR